MSVDPAKWNLILDFLPGLESLRITEIDPEQIHASEHIRYIAKYISDTHPEERCPKLKCVSLLFYSSSDADDLAMPGYCSAIQLAKSKRGLQVTPHIYESNDAGRDEVVTARLCDLFRQ